MDKSIAMKWANKLEDPNIKQGRGHLFHAGRMCCLGVLQKEVLGLSIKPGDAILSKMAQEIADMKTKKGIISGDSLFGFKNLIDANDAYGKKQVKFPDLAKWIRENYTQL